ncbi:MAG: L7Ae/L30e/S12e/Gadd45 family ribosomal protein [bacterium]
MKDKIFKLVGLARRAGKIALGMSMLEKMIRRKRVALILIAEDATTNTVDKVLSLQPSCPYLVFGAKTEWGKALGRDQIAVLGVLDPNFAEGILLNYDAEEGKQNGKNVS